jgi:uncharacterized protein (DUF1800 family)
MLRHQMPDLDPQWAWAPFEPGGKRPWDMRLAGHLLRRAAGGASFDQLQQAVADGLPATLNRLLEGEKGWRSFYEQAGELADSIAGTTNEAEMRAWWLYVILRSPHPLLEQMTLFWHNHFATSQAKVNDVAAMLGQNQLLRRHALGKFGPLLHEISKDPAMMVWLDTGLNKKGKPNENYARELMELFTLGRGHYSERDIREAARAFTGWSIKDGKYLFVKNEHDAGPKSVFGKSDRFGGEGIVELCLDRPETARFLVVKLIRGFISDTLAPSPRLVEALANPFRDSDYDIQALMRTLLGSNLFFSEHAYRARIKSPTAFAVGIVKGLQGNVNSLNLAQATENLGQKLFFPPSVKGWDGGAAWLNSTTLLMRQNLAQALTGAEDNRFGRRCDPAALIRQRRLENAGDQELVEFFVDLFLQGDLASASRARLLEYRRLSARQPYPVYWTEEDIRDQRVRSLCYLVLTQPEFQLD